VAIASAPLLFATDGQINLLVPSDAAAYIGKTVDIVVTFGVAGNGAPRASAPFAVTVAAASPGVFAFGGDGQGDGAFLAKDWSLIGQGNEAGMRQSQADSDVVQMYVTGLGVPDSSADNAATGKGLWPADCVSASSYMTSLNKMTSGTTAAADGALILSSHLNAGRLAPCMKAAANVPAVLIGGQPATVVYAGWAPDLVAGQYQLNVRLPSFAKGPFTTAAGEVLSGPIAAPVSLPVLITARGRSSQSGVSMWVAPRLKVTGLSASALTGTAGAAWSTKGSNLSASGGTPPYQYSLSSGVLPAGLSLNPATGVISGTPAADAAGSYAVMVVVSDSAVIPITGRAAFTLTVATGK
jgi:hypothetical protein